MNAQTDFERLGGEDGVRPLVEAVCAAFFTDFIIGFRFEGKDHARIVAKEYEHARAALGGPGEEVGEEGEEVDEEIYPEYPQLRRAYPHSFVAFFSYQLFSNISL